MEHLDPIARPGRAPEAATHLLTISNYSRSHAAGLSSMLEPAMRELGGVWLARADEVLGSGTAPLTLLGGEPTRVVFHIPHAHEQLHREFCDRTLWPLLHGFRAQVATNDEAWLGYCAANDAYARVAAMLAQPGCTVWAHDHHLLLLGDALRARGHHGPLGLFVHTPFPAPDLFETLPWSDQILDRLQAYDVIGFQTRRWADNFLACFGRRRRPEVVVAPAGIEPYDPHWFAEADPAIERLKSRLGHRRLLLAVDRLEYTKGVVEHLLAYEHLLERYPEWRGRVAFVQLSFPARTDDVERKELRGRVDRLIGRINGVFGEADWTPIRYLCRPLERRALAQLYRVADVAVVTPLCDGMSLVAKEYIAAQDPARPGALVLSRFTGAAQELEQAILTNPYHAPGLASDIDRALCMPLDDRRRRHEELANTVLQAGAREWARRFVGSIRAAHHRAILAEG